MNKIISALKNGSQSQPNDLCNRLNEWTYNIQNISRLINMYTHLFSECLADEKATSESILDAYDELVGLLVSAEQMANLVAESLEHYESFCHEQAIKENETTTVI